MVAIPCGMLLLSLCPSCGMVFWYRCLAKQMTFVIPCLLPFLTGSSIFVALDSQAIHVLFHVNFVTMSSISMHNQLNDLWEYGPGSAGPRSLPGEPGDRDLNNFWTRPQTLFLLQILYSSPCITSYNTATTNDQRFNTDDPLNIRGIYRMRSTICCILDAGIGQSVLM